MSLPSSRSSIWVNDMTVAELIEHLEKFNQDREVIIFDDQSIPYSIDKVIIDTVFKDKAFSHIVIKPIAE